MPLVVIEGNYLLVARHREFGRTPEQARALAYGSGQANADVIAATRGRADVVVAG